MLTWERILDDNFFTAGYYCAKINKTVTKEQEIKNIAGKEGYVVVELKELNLHQHVQVIGGIYKDATATVVGKELDLYTVKINGLDKAGYDSNNNYVGPSKFEIERKWLKIIA